MTNCGVNIPLEQVVEAIINQYGSVISDEVLRKVSLTHLLEHTGGVATDLTLKSSVTLDDSVKADLCAILQACITDRVRAELGCDRDNHVTGFAIDRAQDQLVITMKHGERYYVSRAALEDWLQFSTTPSTPQPQPNTGGIASGELIISPTDPKQVIKVTNKDDTVVDIDVSALQDLRVEWGELVGGNMLRLHRSDGSTLNIDVSVLTPPASPYIVSGVMVERNGGYWLDFTRNDNTKVEVDMTAIINKIIGTVFDRVMAMGYRINTQDDDYTLTGDDFNGRTLLRANKAAIQNITVPKPDDESFVGKAIIVRKTAGDVGTFVNLVAGDGVTISPPDSTPIRRLGSSVTLVYIGDGVYDVFGELP